MVFSFRKTGYGDAVQIAAWEYPAPYEKYNLHNSPRVVVRLVEGRYYSVLAANCLIGFFCYGPASQLIMDPPARLYADPKYFDVGLGMHPAACGRGLGPYFVEAGLAYAEESFGARHFRLTVARDNLRAIKVYARLGFEQVGRIKTTVGPILECIVMTLDNFAPSLTGDWDRLTGDLTTLLPADD